MLFDVASSMFRCHTGPITGNGVPTTQAKPPSGIIYVYLFPERSNHFSLAIFKCLHIFYSLTIYIYIYYSVSLLSLSSKFPRIRRRRRILMEEKRNSSALPVQWLAASRTIRADSGIEADKRTRYDIVVRDKDITHYYVYIYVYTRAYISLKMCLRSTETFDPRSE